jgi:hypothetical protein
MEEKLNIGTSLLWCGAKLIVRGICIIIFTSYTVYRNEQANEPSKYRKMQIMSASSANSPDLIYGIE